jgi:hypothetical protein
MTFTHRCCANCLFGGYHEARDKYVCTEPNSKRFGQPAPGLTTPCAVIRDDKWTPRTHGALVSIARRTGRALIPSGKQMFRAVVLVALAGITNASHDTLVWLGLPDRFADLIPLLLVFWAIMQTVIHAFFTALDHLYEAIRREWQFASDRRASLERIA